MVLFVAALLSSATAMAQSGRGGMHGYVAFEGVNYVDVGKSKVRARIELRATTTGDGRIYNGETNEYGAFDLKEIAMGDYMLRISAPGFRTYETEVYLPSDFIFNLATHLRKANASEQAPSSQPKNAVARIWHGRVKSAKADEYYEYLNEAGIKKIEAIEGNLGAQVLRRTQGDITEFVVISYWESRDAIRKFAGDDIEKTHFLPRDREYLLELEPTVRHFDVLLDHRK